MYIKCSDNFDASTFSDDTNIRVKNAHNTTSEELLSIYAYDPSFLVRYNVANNPRTPGEVLADIYQGVYTKTETNNGTVIAAEDQRKGIDLALAKHPNTPPEILEELSKSELWSVRWKVASNPNASDNTILALVDDSDCDVRCKACIQANDRGLL